MKSIVQIVVNTSESLILGATPENWQTCRAKSRVRYKRKYI